MDTIFVHNLSIPGKHGVGQEERNIEQEFLVDIEVDFDLGPSGASDNLNDTANYSDFVSAARDVIENNSFYLIEKIAHLIAEKILADKRISRVRVSIRKPTVFPTGIPGISIERNR